MQVEEVIGEALGRAIYRSLKTITPKDFTNGGEIDFTEEYYDAVRQKHGRISMRHLHGRFYQVYAHYVNILSKPEEEVIKTGTLEECVKFTNALFDLNDAVVAE